MGIINLRNSLNKSERTQLVRLLGHDMTGLLAVANNGVWFSKDENNANYLDEYRVEEIISHSGKISSTIEDLTFADSIQLWELAGETRENYHSMVDNLKTIRKLHKDGFEYDVDESMPTFLTHSPALYCVLFNLTKNAMKTRADNVVVNVDYPNRFPSDAVYIPRGAKKHKEFVGLHISDNGKGFPQDKDFLDYFKTIPEKGKSGFGLYFTGLMGKLLQAPVDIKSEPGNTKVSFFQPIYKK